jgi:hypothetical protein
MLLGRRFLQVSLLLLNRGDNCLDKSDALPCILRTVHEKSIVPMLLVFRGLFAERAADALTELQLCSGYCRVDIRETFPAQVFHLRKKLLEISGATSEFFNRDGFGACTELF